MGLLTEGKAFNAEQTAATSSYVREHGITQFLSTWRRVKDIHDDELKFGDEIECGVFMVNHEEKTVKLSIRSAELRKILVERESTNKHQWEGCTWHPEFGAWMVESTPSRPYSNYANELLRVERNMILRRRRLLSSLSPNEIAPYVTNFPLLGVANTIHDPKPFAVPHSQSKYLPDFVINPHPRFAALTENIRSRRQEKVNIRVPLFQDINTPEFLEGDAKSQFKLRENYELENDTFIHMDAMGFGMGMCCLQVTFQARDVDESRYMYDQLAVLAPIMLAITAASPIFKGRLSDVDGRWDIIAQSVDDRTPAERGLVPDDQLENHRYPGRAGEGIRRIYKSRYDSICTYIYHCRNDPNCHRTLSKYNDIPCPVDEEVKTRLIAEGVDANLAHHIAHLFIRDPLVIFEGMVELNDDTSTDHFENIQSTNWNTCRWKPPPPRSHPEDPHIGWRTEFRSMEVQLTDFENAAFTVFVVLITRVLLAFDLALYIPLSKVDENMHRAQMRDAARAQKFYFRKHLEGIPLSKDKTTGDEKQKVEEEYEEMTLNEIFNGKSSYFPGLIPLVYAYLDYINCEPETYNRISMYLTMISKRANGELMTPASWIRQQVISHPDYRRDSFVSNEIAYDLLQAAKSIGDGFQKCPEILGDVVLDKVRVEDAYGQLLAGRLTTEQKSELIQRLVNRANILEKTNAPTIKKSYIGTDKL